MLALDCERVLTEKGEMLARVSVVNFYGIACEYGWRRIERRFLPKSVWVETLYEIKEVPAAEKKTTQAVVRQARNSVDFENA